MPPLAGNLEIISAGPDHLPLILTFIRRLAEYEKLAHRLVVDEEVLRQSLFGLRPAAEVLLAFFEKRPAGFAVFFHNFSTFSGRPGIYLEDLFVEPEFRSRGIGKALLVRLAKTAQDRGCARLDWAVLDWNEPAIRFYRRLGAEPLSDWTLFRLSGPGLTTLAQTQS
jgi:GNAT superfamily N-acetyltransferase